MLKLYYDLLTAAGGIFLSKLLEALAIAMLVNRDLICMDMRVLGVGY